MHTEKNIVHRDIKPPNILWYEGGIIKITDFNHAIEFPKLVESNFKGLCGTPWFKAPELVMDMPYSYEIDIWSLGCVFEHLLTGKFIFKFDDKLLKDKQYRNDEIQKKKLYLNPIFDKLGVPNNKTWPDIEKQPVIQKYDSNKTGKRLRHYLQDEKVSD